MFTSLQTRLKKASRWLPVALLPFAAQAQNLNYGTASATNTAGTYTDLGTTGTAITTANTDDANSAAQPIGFTFNFNGTAFTEFVLSTNGLIRLGAAAPSAANLFFCNVMGCSNEDPVSSANAADVNLLFPFNMDLEASATGTPEYRVATTGTAPNRVATIQWKNVRDKADSGTGTQYANMQFQVKLYETTNNVEFVYGTFTGNLPDGFRFAAVGIKGAGAADGQTVLANKTGSALPWANAVFITGNYTNTLHNIRGTVPPDAGRTYRFAPSPANDATVQAIYTLGTVSSYALPVTVQAVIRNLGTAVTTSRTVTLTVSGATTFSNTQPVPALPVGSMATITFAPYSPTATTGTNTVTVALTGDDAPSNNTATTQQALTADRLSYLDPAVTTFAGGFGSNSTTVTSATVYVKYRTNATSTTVTAVTPTFAGPATTANDYQVLVLAAAANGLPGTVLYTSPVRVRPLAGGADVVPVPGTAVSGDFFVAARQLSTSNFGLAYQNESPLRLATFYFSTDGAAFTDLSVVGTPFRAAISVTLRNPLATRNEALAATVALYPSPAHQRFTLSVPAGNLHAASARLLNALGQVVRTRQLNLPAAGGTTDFDVSNLAVGVYSLELKAGNDLVVKRVVVE